MKAIYMASEKTYNYLEKFGLNQYEIKAYIAIVAKGVATASELSDISGVPYTRVYDVLNSLESYGLVLRLPGRPMRFKAIHPSLAIKNLKRKMLSEFEKKIEDLEREEEEIISELNSIYGRVTERVGDNIQLLKGRTSIDGMVISLLSQAIKNNLIMFISPNTLKRHLTLSKDTFKKLAENKDNLIILVNGRKGDLPEWLKSIVVNVKSDNLAFSNILVVGNNVFLYESIPDDLSQNSEYDIGVLIKSERTTQSIRILVSNIRRTWK